MIPGTMTLAQPMLRSKQDQKGYSAIRVTEIAVPPQTLNSDPVREMNTNF